MDKRLIKKCDNILRELTKFSKDILETAPGTQIEKILEFENTLQLRLPEDFKYILKTYNGASIMGTEFLGIGNKQHDLLSIYMWETKEAAKPIPKYLIPFSPNGRGDHYCFDTQRFGQDGTCKIVFWQWDYSPDFVEEIETTNDNFASWLQEVMIDWILEDYNYDGTKK